MLPLVCYFWFAFGFGRPSAIVRRLAGLKRHLEENTFFGSISWFGGGSEKCTNMVPWHLSKWNQRLNPAYPQLFELLSRARTNSRDTQEGLRCVLGSRCSRSGAEALSRRAQHVRPWDSAAVSRQCLVKNRQSLGPVSMQVPKVSQER